MGVLREDRFRFWSLGVSVYLGVGVVAREVALSHDSRKWLHQVEKAWSAILSYDRRS